jgi:hypothetical protein
MRKYHVPTIGIAIALCLFVVAASYYPGGTTLSADTVGYSWVHNFVSALFQPVALNGDANPARSFAIAAMLLLCLSWGLMFWQISRQVKARVHQKTIEISGLGLMVYAFLIVTPLHNLMVDLALLFGLVALFATTHDLYLERHPLLFGWGALCLALLMVSAMMYYGNVLYGLLPVMQKVSLGASSGWLITVYYTRLRQGHFAKLQPT